MTGGQEEKTANREIPSMVTGLVECHICFSIIKETGVGEHLGWHRVAGSPMGHGLYLLQFPELDMQVGP